MRFINVAGVIQKARRFVSASGGAQDDEVKDPTKLANIIRHVQRRISDVEARTPPEATEFEVTCGDRGAQVRLSHNVGGPVRYYVTSWTIGDRDTAPAGYGRPGISLLQRATGVSTWVNAATDQTNGCQFRLKRTRDIVGVRFGWAGNGAAHDVVVKLWDNSGVLLTSKTSSVNNTGVYEVYFDAPYIAYPLSQTFTVSIRQTAGTLSASYTNDVTWKTQVTELGEDLTLMHHSMTAAGDAYPNAAHGAAVSILCEPILGHERGGPELVIDRSSSDMNNLVLNSYVRGRAVIRVEQSQSGLT
jgi:hypothetical protein